MLNCTQRYIQKVVQRWERISSIIPQPQLGELHISITGSYRRSSRITQRNAGIRCHKSGGKVNVNATRPYVSKHIVQRKMTDEGYCKSAANCRSKINANIANKCLSFPRICWALSRAYCILLSSMVSAAVPVNPATPDHGYSDC